MQVVILAGGQGTRLRPLTDKIPKAMVLIRQKPFLRYQLEYFKAGQFKNILILLGNFGEQIVEYFKDGSQFGINIEYSYEKEILGTAGALKKAEDKLEKCFLLVYGDTYLTLDYQDLIGSFRQQNKIGMITAYDNLEKIAPHNLMINSAFSVINYNKSNEQGMNCLDAGAMVFRRTVTGLIEKEKNVSLEEDVYPKLIASQELAGYITHQRFYDIGSPLGLKLLDEKLGIPQARFLKK